MQSTQSVYQLRMRYPFGISRDTVTELPTVLFQLEGKGQGEGSPVRYKKQRAEDILAALEALAAMVTPANIDDIEGLDAAARAEYPLLSSAVCAFNLALWDARGRRNGLPVWKMVGGAREMAATTYTISLADNETMERRAREAAQLPLLKIKLGRDEVQDLDAMKRIRKAAPRATLRVDANAGWSLGTALSIIPRLQELGVEFVEQPLAIGNYDDLKVLHEKSPLPIMADEDAQDTTSLERLKGRCSGINIKLMKCGGITEALKMIAIARAEGWKVLLGCMLETRLGLGAGAAIGALVDYIDLDAHMLTVNDPFPPGSLEILSPEPPLADGPGFGLPMLEI